VKKTDEKEEKVWNARVIEEEEKDLEIKGIEFRAKFYKTSVGITGIRVPLKNNGKLWDEFGKLTRSLSEIRIPKEKEQDLTSFATFGKADKGLDFFDSIGFYVYKDHVIFHSEKDVPEPMKRLETFVEYYRKKFGIEVKPKHVLFDSLSELEMTDLPEDI